MRSIAKRLSSGVAAVALTGGMMMMAPYTADAAVYWWSGPYSTFTGCESYRVSMDDILNPPDGDVVSGCLYFPDSPSGPREGSGPGYYFRYYLTYV